MPLILYWFQLMPLDSTIEKEWEDEMKRHRDAVKKLNSLSLNKEKDEPEPELDPPYERVSCKTYLNKIPIYYFFLVRPKPKIRTM